MSILIRVIAIMITIIIGFVINAALHDAETGKVTLLAIDAMICVVTTGSLITLYTLYCSRDEDKEARGSILLVALVFISYLGLGIFLNM